MYIAKYLPQVMRKYSVSQLTTEEESSFRKIQDSMNQWKKQSWFIRVITPDQFDRDLIEMDTLMLGVLNRLDNLTPIKD